MNDRDLFEACLAETLRWEGGWSDDPLDPGGPTNRGLTLAVFAAWRAVAITPDSRPDLVAALRALTHEEAGLIYRAQYWRPIRGDTLPPPVAMAVFDFSVNSGTTRAVRHLQAALGCGIDGHIGSVTLRALQRAPDPLAVALAVLDRRRAFVRQIPTFFRFGRGWLRRIDGIEATCRRLAAAPPDPVLPPIIPPADTCPDPGADWTTETHGPLADADAQSATQGRATVPDAATSAGSATARTAEAIGTGGSVQLGVDVAGAIAKTQHGGTSAGAMQFVLELAQRPSFWLALAAVAGAAYVWLERRRQRVTL